MTWPEPKQPMDGFQSAVFVIAVSLVVVWLARFILWVLE